MQRKPAPQRAVSRMQRRIQRTARSLDWISRIEKWIVLGTFIAIVWIGSFFGGPLGMSALAMAFPVATWAVWNVCRILDAIQKRDAIRIRIATRAGSFFFAGIFVIYQIQWIVGCDDPGWVTDHPGDSAYCTIDAARICIIASACVAGVLCLFGAIGAVSEILLYTRLNELELLTQTPSPMDEAVPTVRVDQLFRY